MESVKEFIKTDNESQEHLPVTFLVLQSVTRRNMFCIFSWTKTNVTSHIRTFANFIQILSTTPKMS